MYMIPGTQDPWEAVLTMFLTPEEDPMRPFLSIPMKPNPEGSVVSGTTDMNRDLPKNQFPRKEKISDFHLLWIYGIPTEKTLVFDGQSVGNEQSYKKLSCPSLCL